MVKAIWAVACPAVVAMTLGMAAGGCAMQRPTPAEGAGSEVLTEVENFDRSTKAAAPALRDPGIQYRIGPEDVLRVSVWENAQLTLDVVVRPDGKISFPLIQDVQAEGLTSVDLADVIHQRLLPFVKDPQVAVIVTQVNAPKVFVLGNVARPGTYPLRSDLSILQVLSLAGGFTQFASPRSIKLVRGAGTKQEVRKVNYYDMIGAGGDGNYLLKPGDTVVVP